MFTVNATNVRNGKLPFRIFCIYIIILLMAVGATWWLARNNYREATDSTFRRLDSSLHFSGKFLMNACVEDSIYVASKSRDPGFEKIVIRYKPKIDSVMLIAVQMHHYILTIKQSLTASSDAVNDNELPNNSQQVKEKVWESETAKNLYDSLNAYSQLLLSIFPFKMEQYNVRIPLDTSNPFSKNVEIWTKTHFGKLTTAAIQSSLTELDYQVWIGANEMTNLICSQWCDLLQLDDNFHYFFTSQNSGYFLPGQTLEISAGLGAFVTNVKPRIFINGQEQTVNPEGYVTFEKTITNEKGGVIPINISYQEPNTGEIKTMSKWISYTVLQPSKK